MQKQKKNFKYKKHTQKLFFKPKGIKRLKNFFKKKPYFLGPNINKIVNLGINKNRIRLNICIKITPNNIFCALIDGGLKKSLIILSAGTEKIKVSKKKLKFGNKIIIQAFLEKIKKYLKKRTIKIKLSGPIKIRKAVLKQLLSGLKLNNIIINVKELKVFNGCRPKKKRRKKQKSLRVFK